MSILTLPAITPSQATWGMVSNTETFTSPLNGAVQTAGRLGDRWKTTLDFYGLSIAQGTAFDIFLASMSGASGRVNVPPFHRNGPSLTGVTLGSGAFVSGANQTGTTLTVTSFKSSQQVMTAGDFFTVNNELKMLTADAFTTVTGDVALQFVPMLRTSPPNGALLNITTPTALMRLDAQEYAITRVPGPQYQSLTLTLVEVF